MNKLIESKDSRSIKQRDIPPGQAFYGSIGGVHSGLFIIPGGPDRKIYRLDGDCEPFKNSWCLYEPDSKHIIYNYYPVDLEIHVKG